MKISKPKMELVMAKANLSVSDLSTKTGISISGISRIKNGTQNPRPVTIGKIAKALNVPVESIIED